MQYPSMVCEPITTSVARRVRGNLACFATSQETASTVARARVPRKSRLCVGGHSSHVAPQSCTEGERPCPMMYPFVARRPIAVSAAQRARAASSRVLQPRERQPAQWRLFACHANAGCMLEATAHTSQHGLSPKERGLPPIRCHSLSRGTSIATRHGARTRQARVLCHLKTDSQRSGARARATRMPAARWISQLARRTTALLRKREASRRCYALL